MLKYVVFLVALFSLTQAKAMGIGFINIMSADEIYLYTNEPINDRSLIYVQTPNLKGETTCCKKLKGSAFKAIKENYVVSSDSADLIRRYALKKGVLLVSGDSYVGISIINADNVEIKKKDIVAYNQKDQLLIKSCFGVEGLNLTSFRNNKIQEHLYYSLGEDLEPDFIRKFGCKSKAYF